MNTKLIVWIVGIFLGAIAIAIAWYIMFASRTVPQQAAQPSTTLPVSGSITHVSSPSATSPQATQTKTMTLTTTTGGTIIANDFIHNGITIPDEANPGNHLLAGNLGYCFSNPQLCQAARATNFTVYYKDEQQSFIITLTTEPIGQARLDMEQFMLKTLGISEQQMCGLNYLVGVTRYVNSQYAESNLGFSFCPGATALPK